VPPLDRLEWNFFADACQPLQFILGASGHAEIAVAAQSPNLLGCCGAKVVNVILRVSRQG
jgi:hypothetical protein